MPASAVETPGVPSSVLDEIRSGALEKAGAEEVIEWGFERFAPRIALSASFGSPVERREPELAEAGPAIFPSCLSPSLPSN